MFSPNVTRFTMFISLLLLLLVLLSACNDESNNKVDIQSTSNPQPADFLILPDADIFLLGDTVYSNAENIDWIQEQDYTLGKMIGEITLQSSDPKQFKNGTSNRLPVGCQIYETNEPFYIAVRGDKEIPYLPMLEG